MRNMLRLLWALGGLGVALGCGTTHSNNGDGGPGGPGPVVCTGTDKACGTVCVDVTSNPGHCGACNTPCEVGQVCFQSTCSLVQGNPYLASVVPGTVVAGGTVTLQVTGQRFAQGATVRLLGSGVDAGIDGEHPLDLKSSVAGSLDNLSLAAAVPAVLEVRVINPGHLVSNALYLTILGGDGGTALPPPTITAISPNQGPSNAVSSVTISGSNFTPSCTARLSGGGLAQPKDFSAVELGAGAIYVAQVNLNGVSPGTYQMSVITSAGQSNALPFTVLTAPPQITTLSPTHGAKGTQVPFTVTGNNFDATSTLQIQGQTGTATAIATSFVSATQLSAGPLDLTSYAVGNYGVFVQNSGSVDSNIVGFVVDSNDPTLVVANPGSGRQDMTYTVTLTGAGFQTSESVTISSPSGLIQPMTLPSTYVNSTTISIPNWMLETWPVGSYNLVVQNAGSNPSGAVSFVVLQGQPIITAINPSSAQTGSTINGSVTGQYLYPTSVVYVDGGSGSAPLPTTFDAGVLYINTDLIGVPTGNYGVTVVNPGPLTSNSVPFTVTP
jgi:hypothetical protein